MRPGADWVIVASVFGVEQAIGCAVVQSSQEVCPCLR